MITVSHDHDIIRRRRRPPSHSSSCTAFEVAARHFSCFPKLGADGSVTDIGWPGPAACQGLIRMAPTHASGSCGASSCCNGAGTASGGPDEAQREVHPSSSHRELRLSDSDAAPPRRRLSGLCQWSVPDPQLGIGSRPLRVDHYQPPSLSQSIVILRLLQPSNPSAPIRPQAVASYPSLTALVPSQLDHDTAQYRLCLSFKLTTRACLDSGKTEPGRLSAGQ